MRNHLYNIGYSRSFSFNTCVIAVGNLSVGGTGKSPMIEYLIDLLNDRSIATLSRGYGRRTQGFRVVGDDDDAASVGDEPYQFYLKYKNSATITVGEDRATAIPEILFKNEKTAVILLDDAYQHRSVIPDLNILLSKYESPFYDDHVLPMGRLREKRTNAKRADLVLITKCKDDLSDAEFDEITGKVKAYAGHDKPVFFTSIEYGHPKTVYRSEHELGKDVLVFTGLADSSLFETYLGKHYNVVDRFNYPDHYSYTEKDVRKIIARFDVIDAQSKFIITSEKDMARLISPQFESLFAEIPLFFIPIKTVFLRDGALFDSLILNTVSKNV